MNLQQAPTLRSEVAASQGKLTVALLAVSAAIGSLWLIHSLGYLEDDAWIHLEFARSFAQGKGFAFSGRVVYGDTSPLWVWMLDAMHAVLGGSWITTAKVLCGFGCVFGFSGIWAFARSTTRSLPTRSSQLFAAVAILVLAASPYFGYWAFSGMEALTACGLAGWACALVSRQRLRPVAFLTVALVAGIAPLLRPEMGFLSVLLGLALLFRLLGMKELSPTARGVLFTAGLLLIAIPFGLWARYAVHQFGSVLPTTNAAKRAAPGSSVLKQLVSIYGFGFPIAAGAVPLLAAWALLSWTRVSKASLRERLQGLGLGFVLVLAWVSINTLFYVTNHTYVQSRYVFVTAPLLTTSALAAALLYWPQIYRAALALALVTGGFFSLWTTWPLVRNKVVDNQITARTAERLATLSSGKPIGVYGIGENGFICECQVIDVGGILNPGVIPYIYDDGKGRINAWLRREGGQYVLGPRPSPDAVLLLKDRMPKSGWSLHRNQYMETEDFELWTLPAGRTDPENMPRE